MADSYSCFVLCSGQSFYTRQLDGNVSLFILEAAMFADEKTAIAYSKVFNGLQGDTMPEVKSLTMSVTSPLQAASPFIKKVTRA